MNALETKVLNMVGDYRSKYGVAPKYINATIMWLNDKEIVSDTTFALFEYDGSFDSDEIFFFCTGVGNFLTLCANIDFKSDDFENDYEFYKEVNKYHTNDPESDDWSYLHRGEDFCVIDVNFVSDNL